jgi:hypothetical protein
MTIAQRKAFFKRPANRAGRVWSTDHVLTMHIFDQAFDFHRCYMLLPFMHFDMVRLAPRGGGGLWGARGALVCAHPHRTSLQLLVCGNPLPPAR